MEEEIKKAYMDWSEKGVSYLNCMYVYDIMMDVDEALQTCDYNPQNEQAERYVSGRFG